MTKAVSKSRGTGKAAVWLIVGTVLFAVVVLAVALARRNDAPEAARERAAVPVDVTPVQAQTLEETVRGIGTLRAAASVDLRSEVAGRIRALHFEEGGAVEEEQLLVELDDEKLKQQLSARQAALRAAMAQQENARRLFERQEQLRERSVASVDEFDRARTDFELAEAEVQRLEAEVAFTGLQLRDTLIRAPFAGMISERRVDRGDYIAIGDPLATIYQVDPLEIAFAVPERYMGQVRLGQSVRVMVAAYPDRAFAAVVDFISPAVDEATRTFLVKARVPNPQYELRPGAFATAVVTVGTREARPVIPEESLVATRMGYLVFVVEDGMARSQEVQTGLRREGMVEVTSGLSVGQEIVRSGHLRLSGGERVSPINEAPPVGQTPVTAAE